jgi:hypothetical protein
MARPRAVPYIHGMNFSATYDAAAFRHDFTASGDFNATTVKIIPASERGRAFLLENFGLAGVAPVSIEVRKSRFSCFVIAAERKGLRVL